MKDYYSDYHFCLDSFDGEFHYKNNNIGSIYKNRKLLSVKSPDFYKLYNLIEEYNIDENTLIYSIYVENMDIEKVMYKNKLYSAYMLIDKIYGMETNHKKFILRYYLDVKSDDRIKWCNESIRQYEKAFEKNKKIVEDFILINLPPYKFKSYFLATFDNTVNYFYDLN